MPRSDIPAVTHVDYSARVQTVAGLTQLAQRSPFNSTSILLRGNV
ncbi:hypothetical protein [Nostoc sp.]